MGKDFLADIPNNRFVMGKGLVSLASNGTYDAFGIEPAPGNCTIVSAFFVPSASQAGSATNYFDLKILDLSTDGSGTTVLASKTLSASTTSIAANAAGSMAITDSNSVTALNVIGVSAVKAGNGIARVAGEVVVWYRLL